MKVKSPVKKDGQIYARIKKVNEVWLKAAATKAGFGRTSHFLDALFDELRLKEVAGKHSTRRKPRPRKGSTRSQRAA